MASSRTSVPEFPKPEASVRSETLKRNTVLGESRVWTGSFVCTTRLGGFSGQHPYSLTELPRSNTSQEQRILVDLESDGEDSPNNIESKTIRLICTPVPRAEVSRSLPHHFHDTGLASENQQEYHAIVPFR
ncbi:hypothetical protein ACO22_03015 [Paracoccidioides brasiliensis]|uniref:Uncharacterized protein n=1 Tax=Paracoccidioides brasiliensis TaxID=121759 RepID=A0A1D2JH07_PARBR|nr:hypothetical protein ACO22_03015 [Paracoccidioides brasiliensis]